MEIVRRYGLVAQLGYEPRILTDELEGEARDQAVLLLDEGRNVALSLSVDAKPVCLLVGGEPMVTIIGSGKGRRNQEMALAVALALDGEPHIAALIAGTDGTDGPTFDSPLWQARCTAVARGSLLQRSNLLIKMEFSMKDGLFNDKRVDFQRLLSFGFAKGLCEYSYSVALVDGQFNLAITVSEQGILRTNLIEVATNETYVLHQVRGACGAFVGRIRDEYTSVLAAVTENCFVRDVFKSDSAKRVIEYVWNTYKDVPEYLWEKFPRYAIFRRQDNAKWYAVLLVVSARKIGLDDDRDIEILDLRTDSQKIDSLVDRKRYFPGYHMNKKHWFTMCLDGSVPIEELLQRIDSSHVLAKKR